MTQLNLKTITQGIQQVNQSYVVRQELDRYHYVIMIAVYLITSLLKTLKVKAEVGFYDNPVEAGYFGWVKSEDQVLRFGPTITVILDESEDELSPYGDIQ